MTLENQEFAVNGGGGGGYVAAQAAAAPAAGWPNTDAVQTGAKRIIWGLARFLLSASETVNSAWDVGLDTALGLLKTGGGVYESVAEYVGHVPVLGFGAAGVGEAIKTSLAVVESTAKHDMNVRKEAFASLNRKISETGSRLYGPTATAANPVVFPPNK